jgi:hypothetical protein
MHQQFGDSLSRFTHPATSISGTKQEKKNKIKFVTPTFADMKKDKRVPAIRPSNIDKPLPKLVLLAV